MLYVLNETQEKRTLLNINGDATIGDFLELVTIMDWISTQRSHKAFQVRGATHALHFLTSLVQLFLNAQTGRFGFVTRA